MKRLAPSKFIRLLTATALLLFLVASVGVEIRAQDEAPTPTPESEEIKRLKDEKTRAELERDIATAERAELDAKFPKPTTTPLAGETTVNEGAVIESEMVSYLSMAYAANRLVQRLNDKNINISNLAIYNEADVNLLLNYNVTTNQLEIVRKQYCKVLAPDTEKCPPDDKSNKGGVRLIVSATSIASSLLGSFVDLTALLRTNVTIQGHSFSIDEAALVSEVFRAIKADGGLASNPNLYYPKVFPPNININQNSQILGQLELLLELKARVALLIAGLEDNIKNIEKTKAKIEKLEADIEELKTKIAESQAELNRLEALEKKHGTRRLPFDALERMAKLRQTIPELQQQLVKAEEALKKANENLAKLEGQQEMLRSQLSKDLQNPANLDDTLSKLKVLNEQFEKFVSTLIKVDSSTGINSLTAYIKAENLRSVLNDDKSYWLQLAVVKAGGNNRIKTNLLIDVFTGGNRLSHSGGVIVQYNLYDRNGKSIVSDTLTEYTGYIKAGKIKKLKNPERVKDVPEQTRALP